jgi:hypothetical protein
MGGTVDLSGLAFEVDTTSSIISERPAERTSYLDIVLVKMANARFQNKGHCDWILNMGIGRYSITTVSDQWCDNGKVTKEGTKKMGNHLANKATPGWSCRTTYSALRGDTDNKEANKTPHSAKLLGKVKLLQGKTCLKNDTTNHQHEHRYNRRRAVFVGCLLWHGDIGTLQLGLKWS